MRTLEVVEGFIAVLLLIAMILGPALLAGRI